MDREQQALYKRRRADVMENMGPNSVGVWFGNTERARNSDVNFVFRQDSDLLYLTGCREPEAILFLCPGGKEGAREVLFVRPRDPKKEIWMGRRLGPERARAYYDVDQTYALQTLPDKAPALLEGALQVFTPMLHLHMHAQRVLGWLKQLRPLRRRGKVTPAHIMDAGALTDEMRLVKQPSELEWMRHAAAINMDAHRAAMVMAQPGCYEYELEALLHYCYRRQGCEGWSYQTIVGTGENATILHYTENDARCEDGELILIDAGCEWNHYASDITRTFPVNGRFSSQQRDVYTLVLKALDAANAMCRPGVMLKEIHLAAVHVLCEGLIALGILEGPLEQALEKETYKTFYMHGTSHWLGLDVHDVGGHYTLEGEARPLVPGMVLTV
ncbi:MAG: aminopeptidase P N-terminal domain-containing protein, partial [Myxococcota bacterium]